MAMTDDVRFYEDLPLGHPRFAYRRLAERLRGGKADRAQAIAAAAAELNGANEELRKFKFILPDYLRPLLSAEETETLRAAVAPRRGRSRQMRMVYPRTSDEFSLDPEFIEAALNLEDGPELPPKAAFFTVGSCFARNITFFLKARDLPADTYDLAEDLNSPISNAFVFDLLTKPAEERRRVLTDWLARLFPELSQEQLAFGVGRKLGRVEALEAGLKKADCIILTLGNCIDFFADGADPRQPLLERVFPKFVAMAVEGDLGVDTQAAVRLKRNGATLRMATHDEARQAIELCLQGIRAATQAPVVVTLSPVPVDVVIGLPNTSPKSATEVDCVSKARLRSAFDEALPGLRSRLSGIHYYPSFEIVRWIGSNLAMPIFGQEDAASRHVSAPILTSVCTTFLDRYVRWSDAASPQPRAEPMPASAPAPTPAPAPAGRQPSEALRQVMARTFSGQASEIEASLVYGIANAPVRTFPYPHIYVENVFPPDVYAELQRKMPDPSALAPMDQVRPVKNYSKERFVLDLLAPMPSLGDEQRDFWSGLGEKLTSGRLQKTLLTKFRTWVETRLEGAPPHEFVDEAMLVEDITNYALGPHTDSPSKVITVLFYLPKDDSQRHMGTSIYTPKDPTRRCPGGPHYDREGFNRVATMPFTPNSMFAFVKSDNSFHGVERVTDADVRRWLMLYDVRMRKAAA